VFDVLGMPDVPEVMRCAPLCMLEAVEGKRESSSGILGQQGKCEEK